MASRQKFRRENQAEIDAFRKAGRELECCHIIAKSNGGANNQHNYLMAGANFNRMMGNRHDDIMCALAYDCGGIEKVKAAIKASPACGYTERDAMSLVRAGRQQFARMQEIQGKAIDVWDEGEVLQVELYSGYSSNHTGVQYDGLDGLKIEDPDYCEWVIQVYNYACKAKPDEFN